MLTKSEKKVLQGKIFPWEYENYTENICARVDIQNLGISSSYDGKALHRTSNVGSWFEQPGSHSMVHRNS